MKRILVAGAFALAVAGQAMAADLPPPAPMPPPRAPAAYVPAPLPVYTWGGIYIGANGGYGFGSSSFGTPLGSGSFDPTGFVAGGTLGFNYQFGSFVLGIEGDGDWANISASTSGGGCGAVGNCQTSLGWLATVRGRAGYAFDRVLVYGTAGGAGGGITAKTGLGSTTNDAVRLDRRRRPRIRVPAELVGQGRISLYRSRERIVRRRMLRGRRSGQLGLVHRELGARRRELQVQLLRRPQTGSKSYRSPGSLPGAFVCG